MLQFISFLFFTGLVGLVTWILTSRDDHRTSTGYFLGGRSLTGVFIAGSLLLTNLSTEQLVGLNGAAFAEGLAVMVWEVLAGVAIVLMALFFLPRFLKSGITTVPQFLGLRFDSGTESLCNIIFLTAYALILLPIILYTGAIGLASILDLKSLTGIASDTVLLWLTVWVVGIIGAIYAIFGGLRTVVVSDTLNGIGLLVGGMLITWFGLSAIGGEGGVVAGMTTLVQSHPERFNSIGAANSSVPFSTVFTGILLLNVFYWCTNQQIIQRTLGAASLCEGQKGVLLCGILKLMGPLYLVLPGLIAFHLFHGQQIAADQAYGTLVASVLPKPLVGFFAAVLVGAILSSFNSALNSAATLFSLGVYRKLIRPQADERQTIRAGAIFGWILAIFAMLVAPLLAGQTSIFAYLQKMNGIYFIPILAVVVVGLLDARVPAKAAKAALAGGILVIALGYFVPGCSDLASTIHEFHFLGLVFAVLVLAMLVVGRLAPMAEPRILAPTGEVDLTPWRHARWIGVVIVAFVVSLYLITAK